MENLTAKTNELSKKIERGQHTTRHVELFELINGGYILDTPGFSMLKIEQLMPDKLKYYFREFDKYNTNCRYTGCSHINEEECAVKAAVSSGELDITRYENFKTIFTELKVNTKYNRCWR